MKLPHLFVVPAEFGASTDSVHRSRVPDRPQ